MPNTGRPCLPEKKQARHALVTHLTEEEYTPIVEGFRGSTFRHMSHYVRALVTSRPVTVLTRDASLDSLVEEVKQLKAELSAIGRNFNQLIIRQATVRTPAELPDVLKKLESCQERYVAQCTRLQEVFDQIASRWLRA